VINVSTIDNNSLAGIGVNAGIPTLNTADIPANIRNGNSQAQQAYSEGLAFEQVLVNQLTTQMASTMGSNGLGDIDGSTDSDSDSLLSSSDSSGFASMFPQALTSSIMSSGGLGMAEEFAQAIDPSLANPSGASSTGAADTPTAATQAADGGSTLGAGGAK